MGSCAGSIPFIEVRVVFPDIFIRAAGIFKNRIPAHQKQAPAGASIFLVKKDVFFKKIW